MTSSSAQIWSYRLTICRKAKICIFLFSNIQIIQFLCTNGIIHFFTYSITFMKRVMFVVANYQKLSAINAKICYFLSNLFFSPRLLLVYFVHQYILCDKIALWPTTEQTHNSAIQKLVFYEEKETKRRRNLKYKTIKNIKNNRPRSRTNKPHRKSFSLSSFTASSCAQ